MRPEARLVRAFCFGVFMARPKAEFEVSAVDRASAVLQKVGNGVTGLGDRMTRRWDSVGAALAKTAAGLYALERVTTLVTGFAKGSADAAKEVKDLAEITGAASKDIQLLGAEMDGNVSAAATALSKLQKARRLALSKGGEELDAFKAAGISVEDLRKKDPMGLLQQMADAFKKSENAGGKLLITQKLLGKSADGLVEVLNKGSGELLEKQQLMQKSGGFFSAEQLERAEMASDAFKILGITWNGLKSALGVSLAGGLTSTLEAVQGWLIVNREVIAQKFDVFIAHLPPIIAGVTTAFKVLWVVGSAIFTVLEKVGHLIGADGMGLVIAMMVLLPLLSGALGLLGGLVGSFGTVLGAGMRVYRMLSIMATMMRVVWLMGRLWLPLFGRALVSALARFATAGIGVLMTALRGLTVFLAANPFTIWLVALAAVAALIYSNWDAIVEYVSRAWERIKAVFDAQGFFGALWQGVLEIFQGYLNAIINLFKKIPAIGKLIPDDFQYNFAERNAAAVTAGQVAKAQQQNFNGKLQVEILGDKKARVTEMKSDNAGMQMTARHGLSGAPA